MGTIKKGVLGSFSGTVGAVIGSSWKGIPYMRSKPLSVKDAKTEKQLSHRLKFGLVMSSLKPMSALLRTGWKLYADKQTSFNAATSYTFANAVTGSYPDYAIDPGKILVSRGSLTPAANAAATVAGKNIEFSWDDNSGAGSAGQTDKALIALLNVGKHEAITNSNGAERMTGTQTVAIPANWLGDSVELYLGFISEDSREVANSLYLGSVIVP